jgi:hypothetical protein
VIQETFEDSILSSSTNRIYSKQNNKCKIILMFSCLVLYIILYTSVVGLLLVPHGTGDFDGKKIAFIVGLSKW